MAGAALRAAAHIDPQNPPWVSTATGTVFDVRSGQDNRVKVALVEGGVDRRAATRRRGPRDPQVQHLTHQRELAAAALGEASFFDQRFSAGGDVSCATCHQPDGSGQPPKYPALAGSPVTTGDMATHIDTVMEGRADTEMQAWAPQLSDLHLAAVMTYERNAWGNNTGDVIQPLAVYKSR